MRVCDENEHTNWRRGRPSQVRSARARARLRLSSCLSQLPAGGDAHRAKLDEFELCVEASASELGRQGVRAQRRIRLSALTLARETPVDASRQDDRRTDTSLHGPRKFEPVQRSLSGRGAQRAGRPPRCFLEDGDVAGVLDERHLVLPSHVSTSNRESAKVEPRPSETGEKATLLSSGDGDDGTDQARIALRPAAARPGLAHQARERGREGG